MSDKELAAKLRQLLNAMFESGTCENDMVAPLDEVCRRLEFRTNPLEQKRAEELHTARMEQIGRAKNAGLGGMGRVVFIQATGELHLFATVKLMVDFMEANGSPKSFDYYACKFHDVAGNEITLMERAKE